MRPLAVDRYILSEGFESRSGSLDRKVCVCHAKRYFLGLLGIEGFVKVDRVERHDAKRRSIWIFVGSQGASNTG